MEISNAKKNKVMSGIKSEGNAIFHKAVLSEEMTFEQTLSEEREGATECLEEKHSRQRELQCKGLEIGVPLA